MEKLRPYFTLRDGSDRRGNSVVPHWIRFCSGFDSVAVCRQREGLPSIRANTTRAKPYAIGLPLNRRAIAYGKVAPILHLAGWIGSERQLSRSALDSVLFWVRFGGRVSTARRLALDPGE